MAHTLWLLTRPAPHTLVLQVKSESHLRAAFSIFDYSSDGYIQADELRRILMNVGEPVTMNDVNALLEEVDGNADGVIDYEEFAKVIRSEVPGRALRENHALAPPPATEEPKKKGLVRRLLRM